MRDQPSISLVIPAWNEERLLPRLLDTVKEARARYRGCTDAIEVIVADNGSTDATAELARAAGCAVVPVERRRIACARNGGAAAASGEILAFVDADFRIHSETFNYIADVMKEPEILGGGTGLKMERWSLGIATTWLLILPPLWLLGFDGGVWFCRRKDFEEIGGYDETVPASEDVLFLNALRRLGRKRRPKEKLATRFRGRRLELPAALATASCRKFDDHGDWHMIPLMIRGAFWMLFARKRLEAYAQRYWYEDR